MIFLEIFIITLIAGAAIPLGGALSYFERIQNSQSLADVKPFCSALGGGLLLSGVCLVLIPEGLRGASITEASLAFITGGVCFYLLEKILAKRGGDLAQFMATLLDFIPESIALGATYIQNPKVALFLGLLIALQNIPEGFNAFSDLTEKNVKLSKHYFILFALAALLGPAAGALGHYYFASEHALLSMLMIFSAAGIIYLIFQDIAPESKVEHRLAPALGSILGFWLGLMGNLVITKI